ncbi:hypothetical protein C922_05320 [Plasmodium inui San Antonio 1]|uniref:Pv-fam-d protein n=1 Tax=Plasmodium inui San Antonio 1 TaxID=1237626 RepID=W6ZYD3_9APIC|nr:hypothetical protein C922_05320 [Plasmodium inui San Antonio 1]EUD64305.1 hypothetical protein C922_05320 [Plasmodium inui San Antonio 1]
MANRAFLNKHSLSHLSVLDSSPAKDRAQNGRALSVRPRRLLCKGALATPTDQLENKKLKERVIKILNEDESSLGKMLNNVVHDASYQEEFNALLHDKGFEKEFNELVSDSSSEEDISSSLHSLSTYDGDDITRTGFAAYPQPPNSTTDSPILETHLTSQTYDANLKKQSHPTIPNPEIRERLSQEPKKFGSVDQFLDEIQKADNVKKMIEILKFYGNSEVPVTLAEKTETTQQVPQNWEIYAQGQSGWESSAHAKLKSQLEAKLHDQLQMQVQKPPPRRIRTRPKSFLGLIYKMLNKVDSKYEDHLLKVLTTNYRFLVKNGKMLRLRYYLDLILCLSPVLFWGTLLGISALNYPMSPFVLFAVIGSLSVLYVLFKLWNCKRICKGIGKYKLRKKFKQMVDYWKK